MSPTDQQPTITQTTLLERPGWTKTLLKRLLGEPDHRKKVYGRTNPICLYLLERVVAAEQSTSFLDAQAAIEKRRMASTKAVKTKTEHLLAAIEAMPLSVDVLSNKQLLSCAISAYNARNPYSDSSADPKADQAFLDRICVNFIRHELTHYDHALEAMAGKTGINKAIVLLRRRIYSAIAQAYPALADECANQLQARHGAP
ncbi:hypothetical protein [Azotobacter chroococcum]|uniref:hypothetical protein n=1 Tax=Azotobacter chroococcum TaxID=353 RepID=UPI0010AE69CB|nr:hypothetical protein [Azotobacter chroococcum]TKD35310.1 hypothetical protein FCG41_17880 [Azotobacter chroococcum]